MSLAICIEIGSSGMLMWNNASFKTEVQKVKCSKAPHIQLQDGVGQAEGRGCSSSTVGVSEMQPPGCAGQQMRWGWFRSAGHSSAGFASVLQQSGFGQSMCEKCRGPSDWVAAGSAHTILSSCFCCGHEKTLLHQCKI